MTNESMQQEQERMDYVISVITEEAERLKSEYTTKLDIQKQLLKQSSEIRINNSSNEAMWESSGELREFEQNLTIKSNELTQVQNRRTILEKMQEDPYFGRIDYHNVADPEDEQIYVGIGSLFDDEDNLVVDWRAPISALYYEGNVGDQVKIKIGDKFQAFEVDLKRQFRVKDGEITGMIDTDNVMGDPYLMEVLEGSSTNQMGPVVATLQKEQNRIVRDNLPRNVLIQGVAGSGKTVVMMQKIAYLLYAFRTHLKADEILLFSPNRIFQAYISQVLPSLGEWDVEGNTFPQFIQHRVSNFDPIPSDVGESSKFQIVKGSSAFYEALERYSRLLKKKYLLFRDIMREDEVLISKEEIQNIYKGIESKGSLASKLDILRVSLMQRLEELKLEHLSADWVDDALQHYGTDRIHQFESQTHNIVKMEGYLRKQIVADAFRSIERRVNSQGYIRYTAQYLHFLRSVPQLIDLEPFGLTAEEWATHVGAVMEKMKENKLSLYDMTGYYALLLQMKGMLTQKAYQYICIDEIQDFTPFQLRLLKKLYPRARYIMAGDLNQNIWQNRLSYKELKVIFEEEEISRHLLLTSYRSTREIMAFANQFALLNDHPAQPIRSRRKPEVLYREASSFDETLKSRLAEHVGKGERIAFLTPTGQAIEKIKPFLESWGVDHQIIMNDDSIMNKQVVAMPIGLAKGLEFDVVVACGTDDILDTITDTSSQQVWYTIFSRAMHQLYVVTSNEQSHLLKDVEAEIYETI
ncbi:RNA polymerase recycling motor HelD [Jeotgalibaca sp. A127]|uniref:RNA polymerase recycling motor HelD n=1 Tax=Jeotgalibaca sp. A127 TaxID=3457324 RepID=UPI003FD59894